MHRPIPAPEPDPEPNPEPDKDVRPRHGDIAPKDWNELFLAIQVRLEGCVSDALLKISDVELRDRRVVTQAVVMECIQAMQLLQAALTVERGEHVQGLDTAPASNRPKEYANVAASAP